MLGTNVANTTKSRRNIKKGYSCIPRIGYCFNRSVHRMGLWTLTASLSSTGCTMPANA